MSNIENKANVANFKEVTTVKLSKEYEFSTGKTDKIQFKGLGYKAILDYPELFYGFDLRFTDMENQAEMVHVVMEYIKNNIKKLDEILPEVSCLQRSDLEELSSTDANRVFMGLAGFLFSSLQ